MLIAKKIILLLFMFFFSIVISKAQCVNTFPYVEDFEGASSPWFSGGLNSDWALGTPSKSTINSAGSGVKCWITGGLGNAIYNGGQKSWLQSPCFDFSTLTYPYLSFLIFWDTERQYDGGNLQYSLNNGTTWINLGAAGGGSDCKTKNWFNALTINNLSGLASPQQGWSGSITPGSGSCLGGNGSGTWVEAAYCLNSLAGEPNVLFRFTFCSGTSCNDYDGIAIDSFSISELVYPFFDFSYNCVNSKTVDFTGGGGDCPTQVQWDFGDPASAANTSSQLSDSHTFSAPGTYTVTFTIKEPCFGFLSIARTVIIPDVQTTVYPVSCPGAGDGAIKATVSGLNSPVYSWNLIPPVAADSIFGLLPGTYQLTVSGDSACTQVLSIEVGFDPDAAPKPLLPDKLLICPGEEIILDPGIFTSYLWSTGSIDPFIAVNDTGWYGVQVTNALGCTALDSTLFVSNCFTGVYVPGAFTPNNDGKNDIFKSYAGEVVYFHLTVYDRFGAEVFISDAQEKGWDGRRNNADCPEGVYVWLIEYRNPQNKLQTIRGRVVLMR